MVVQPTLLLHTLAIAREARIDMTSKISATKKTPYLSKYALQCLMHDVHEAGGVPASINPVKGCRKVIVSR